MKQNTIVCNRKEKIGTEYSPTEMNNSICAVQSQREKHSTGIQMHISRSVTLSVACLLSAYIRKKNLYMEQDDDTRDAGSG